VAAKSRQFTADKTGKGQSSEETRGIWQEIDTRRAKWYGWI